MEKQLRHKLRKGVFTDVSPVDSKRMRAVRGRGNKSTETRLRLALVRTGIRGWKLKNSSLAGKPDFLFPLEHLVVFVDGCFWHGCPQCGHYPRKNKAFWRAKIDRNHQRDEEMSSRLHNLGYTVLRFWEHELADNLLQCVQNIEKAQHRLRVIIRGSPPPVTRRKIRH